MPPLAMLAGTLGLSRVELLDSRGRMAHGEKIQADFVGGRDSGVESTPCIFVNGHRPQPGLTLAASITTAMALGCAAPRPAASDEARGANADSSEDASGRLPEAPALSPDRPLDP